METFEVAKKIEQEIISCKDNPLRKDYSHQRRGGTIRKPSNEEKGKDAMDLKNIHKVIKKLTNKIINDKINNEEGYSNKKPYQNFFRRLAENKPLELPPPPTNLNFKLDDVA